MEIVKDKKADQANNKIKTSRSLTEKIFKVLNKYFHWIILILVLIIFIFGYLLVVGPAYDKLYQKRQVDLVGLENTISGLKESQASSLQFINRTVDFTDQERELMSLALPNKFDLPSLMVQLEALASRRGFWVESISVNEPKKSHTAVSERLHKVNIDMSVVGGDYRSFKKFLGAMEDSIMVFDILTIDFGSLDSDNFQYDLNFVTYYYIDGVQ
jgi:Tfp pilus assembly protein PilO